MQEIPIDEQRKARALARSKPQTFRRYTEAEFDQLTGPEKAVAVAKDVLAWISRGKITPTPGTYLSVRHGGAEVVSPSKVNGFSCKACALGAVLACTVEASAALSLHDQRLADFGIQQGAHKLLEDAGAFDRNTLIAIESAFEVADFGSASTDPQRIADAVDFGESVTKAYWGAHRNPPLARGSSWKDDKGGATRRLRAIMQNIIDNEGTFAP